MCLLKLSFTTVCQSMASSADGALFFVYLRVLYLRGWVILYGYMHEVWTVLPFSAQNSKNCSHCIVHLTAPTVTAAYIKSATIGHTVAQA